MNKMSLSTSTTTASISQRRPLHHEMEQADHNDDDSTSSVSRSDHDDTTPNNSTSKSRERRQQQKNRKICIFELPKDWDLMRLPPTVHANGDLGDRSQQPPTSLVSTITSGIDMIGNITHSSTTASTNKRPDSRTAMWCKSYITTSCDMGDDLSSLELDVEEEHRYGGSSSSCHDLDWDSDHYYDISCSSDDDHPIPVTSAANCDSTVIQMAWWRRIVFLRRQRGSSSPSSSSRRRGGSKSTKSSIPSTTSYLCNRATSHDRTEHQGDDSSVETVTSYRWISPSTREDPIQNEQKQKQMTKTQRGLLKRLGLPVRQRRSTTNTRRRPFRVGRVSAV